MAALIAYYSDKGRVKATNEDAFVVRTASSSCGDIVMAIVCDGMGGLSCGDLASTTVVRAFYDWFSNDLPMWLTEGYDYLILKAGLDSEIRRLNVLLEDYADRKSIQIGTTLTMFLSIENHLIVANVGDSRVYELKQETLTILTKDHSLAQREVDSGRLRAEDIESFPNQNILTMSMGSHVGFLPDIWELEVSRDAAYLLCSDGFRHKLSNDEIREEIISSVKDGEDKISETLELLAERAMQRGETDNITAVVVCVGAKGIN